MNLKNNKYQRILFHSWVYMCLCVCVCQRREKNRGSQTLKSVCIKKKKKFKKKIKKCCFQKIECEWGNNMNVCSVELFIFIICVSRYLQNIHVRACFTF